ncbi:MAG TPA: serine hydrolase domain-containing protein, partial [Candidatus Sulfotelmatobacter sp.]|nr:serine hydrolase domain-containing protein [Candidatus Sulfotelmatobacter sp.]
MRSLGILGLALFLAFAGVTGAATAPTRAAAAKPLARDTPLAMPGGATFTAPAGWTVTTHPHEIVLEPPEADSHLALIDVEAADAKAAVAAGWARYRPEAHRPLWTATAQAPHNGWQERHLYRYETSPDEKAVVYAVAWRADREWIVAIVEASWATFEKRGAAFAVALETLRPKGFKPENFAGKPARPLDARRIAAIEDFVRQAMRQFGIPGVGLALIDRGKVVFEGGFGVKLLGRPDAVDADTLFLAASNTKALTTLLLAELVDAGKLRWDEPVTQAYPAFRLGNAAITRQVLVKHLVCACTGMPRQDFEWLFNFARATPASSLALLGTMQPTSRFGEVYQYSNLMAAAAGFVAASVIAPGRELGAAYDDAMRTMVFRPLGMSRTTFDFAAALGGDAASPHGSDIDGKTVPARMDMNYSVVPLRPAGGMWTSAHDLARYVVMELARGKLPDGRRLVSAANLLARRKGQVQAGDHVAYGMGLVISRHYGIPVISHGGSMFGYKSDMLFLPDQGVGAVLLTNADSGGYLTGLIQRRLLEVLFDARPEAAAQMQALAAQRAANV